MKIFATHISIILLCGFIKKTLISAVSITLLYPSSSHIRQNSAMKITNHISNKRRNFFFFYPRFLFINVVHISASCKRGRFAYKKEEIILFFCCFAKNIYWCELYGMSLSPHLNIFLFPQFPSFFFLFVLCYVVFYLPNKTLILSTLQIFSFRIKQFLCIFLCIKLFSI